MKRNILHTLWAAALLLTGCTQEELPLPGADNAAPLPSPSPTAAMP